MGAIDIVSVRKSFGPVEVLRSVDLAIAKGEFVVLVGPSGCGKSTLLRMIAGLEDVTGGDIVIAGRRVNDLPPKDRNLAMVFQSYALYPHMTVAGNMSYALRLRKTAKERIGQAVSGAANLLGLGQLTERRPKQLSGGQRQRVAMGRAIVREPAAFLFDEPLSNLDARLREQMRAEIKKLHGRLGATSIYVTHDQIEAMTLADRIVAMEGGEIRQVGTPAELYDRPANRFVAGFIGSPAMNFLDALAKNGWLDLGAGMTVEPPAPVADGTELVLGIRPEHVALGDAAAGSPLGATVEIVEPTGMGAIVHLRLGNAAGEAGHEAAPSPLKAFHLGAAGWRVGETVPLALPARQLHLFERATGRRLEVSPPPV